MRTYQFIKLAKLLVCAVPVFVVPLCVHAGNTRVGSLSEKEAVSLLLKKIKRNHLYPRSNYDCLGFIVEKKTAKLFDIALREIHDNKCPGDPGVSPVVDRFRVMRSSANVFWYDFTQDRYASLMTIGSQHK